MSEKDYDKEEAGTAITSRASPGGKYEGQVDEGIASHEDLHRKLKPRQISMIALGCVALFQPPCGAIGTGLVIGSGSGLVRGGPVGLFLAYVIMGFACFATMCSLGEQATFLPHKKGFSGYASRFVDPALGFALGWIYLAKYLIVTPNNIVAAAIVISYWTDKVPAGAWIAIFLVGCICLNVLGVKLFGHIEYVLSAFKVVVLTGLILLGIIIDLGGAGVERIGFRHWKNKPFGEYLYEGTLGRFTGVWSCFVVALFAYMGSELVGVTFGEAKNPRKTIPKTIKQTLFRLLFFYVGSIFVVSLLLRCDDPLLIAATKKSTGASASPFVVAIELAGINALPDIINASILMFVLSAANSDLYVGSRTLYALAAEGHAPRFFMRTNRFGTPYFASAFCSAVCCIAFLAVSSGSKVVFNYFVATATMAGALTWATIMFSHLAMQRAMKAQGIPRSELPWQAPFQPYMTYIALFITVVVAIFKGFDAFTITFNHKTFITHYFLLPCFFLAFFGYKLIRKTKWIRPEDVDLVTGRREFDADEAAWEAEKPTGKQALWRRIFNSA
ncbi:hypothetical protein JCM8547_003256 [Rhodosporidiobolus lusitaniae]